MKGGRGWRGVKGENVEHQALTEQDDQKPTTAKSLKAAETS